MTKLMRALALLCVIAMLGGGAAFAEAAATAAATATPAPEQTAEASSESAANEDGTYNAQMLSNLPFTEEQWVMDEGSRAYFAVLMMMEVSSYKELGLDADIQNFGLPGIYVTTLTAETVPSVTAVMFYADAGRAWVCTYYPDAKTFRVEEAEVADAAAYMEGLKTAGTIGEYNEVVYEAISYVLSELQTMMQQ